MGDSNSSFHESHTRQLNIFKRAFKYLGFVAWSTKTATKVQNLYYRCVGFSMRLSRAETQMNLLPIAMGRGEGWVGRFCTETMSYRHSTRIRIWFAIKCHRGEGNFLLISPTYALCVWLYYHSLGIRFYRNNFYKYSYLRICYARNSAVFICPHSIFIDLIFCRYAKVWRAKEKDSKWCLDGQLSRVIILPKNHHRVRNYLYAYQRQCIYMRCRLSDSPVCIYS